MAEHAAAPSPSPSPQGPGSFLSCLDVGARLWAAAWGRWTVVGLGLLAVVVLAMFGVGAAFPEWAADESFLLTWDRLPADLLANLIFSLTGVAAMSLALAHVRVGTPELAALVRPFRWPAVWVVTLVLTTVTTIVDVLTIAGGSLLGILATYVVLHAIDGATVGTSLVLGWATMRSRFLSRFGFLLLCGLVGGFGVLICGVGLLITLPIAAIAVAASHAGDRDADVGAGLAPASG